MMTTTNLIQIPDFDTELNQLTEAPPADSQTGIEYINNIKTLISKIGACLKSTVNGANAAISQNNELIKWRAEAETRILALDEKAKAAPGSNSGMRPRAIDEVIKNLKILSSDKSEFYLWNVKLINALTRVQPDARIFMSRMLGVLDSKGYNTLADDWKDMYRTLNCQFKEDAFSEDLYYALVEKTEGEAAVKVNAADKGNGIHAYQTLYLWFAGTTGLALSKRTEWVMSPPMAKNPQELAMLIPKWTHEITQLANYGEDYDLRIPYKITALKLMMTKFKDHFVNMQEASEAKSTVKQEQYEELLKRVTNFATNQRLEENFQKSKSDPMDINYFGTDQWVDPSWDNYYFAQEGNYQDQNAWEWSQPNTEAQPQYGGSADQIPVPTGDSSEEAYLNAVGKGKAYGKGWIKGKGKGYFKGKGKGKFGGNPNIQCYNCGKYGHTKWQCRSKGKGKGYVKGLHAVSPDAAQDQGSYEDPHKGKGKGQFNGHCYACGQYGHSQNYCPQYQGVNQVQYAQYHGQGGAPPGISMGGHLGSVSTSQVNCEDSNINQIKDMNNATSDIIKTSVNNFQNDINGDNDNPWQVRISKARSRWDMRPSTINSIAKVVQPNSNSVCSVKHQEYVGDFERVKVTMDSGAIDSVSPPDVGRAFPIVETFASKNNIDYKGPNDSPIKNYGQRCFQGLNDSYGQMSGAWQVADVNKVLGSVDKAVDALNTVVFDSEGSYIYNKPTKQTTAMYREGGEFKYDLWIPRPRVLVPVTPAVEVSKGAFGTLAKPEEKPQEAGFQWQDPQ